MDDPYAFVREHFATVPGVVVNSGRGAQGMKVGTKMFAMFLKGDLLLTLPAERVTEEIGAGRGLPFDPGTGKVMKNRLLVPADRSDCWIELARESARAAGASDS